MFKKIIPILALMALMAQPTLAQKRSMKNGFEKYQKPDGQLPQLKIVTLNHSVLNNRDLIHKHHLILMLFNPTCSHCIKMTKEIMAHIDLFKNTKVVLMAPRSMMPELSDFYKKTKINKYPNITVGIDSAFAIDKLYIQDNRTLPQINIYNKYNRLEKVFKGDTKISQLKPYLP